MWNQLVLFVPSCNTTRLAAIVAPGSAIIGPQGSDDFDEDAQVTVDYEGNVNGSVNIKTYADRARHAADRQKQHYPTTARSVALRRELLQVGWVDPERGITLLPGVEKAVASWLGVDSVDPQELQFS